MKALRLHARGDARSLAYEEAPRPRLGPADALVRAREAYLGGGRDHARGKVVLRVGGPDEEGA